MVDVVAGPDRRRVRDDLDPPVAEIDHPRSPRQGVELEEEERAPERVRLVPHPDEVAGTFAVGPSVDLREQPAFAHFGADAPQQIQANVHEHLTDGSRESSNHDS